MTDRQALVTTLTVHPDTQSNNRGLLYDATLEARSVYGDTSRPTKDGVDRDTIPDRVADDATLVKNAPLRVGTTALGAIEIFTSTTTSAN